MAAWWHRLAVHAEHLFLERGLRFVLAASALSFAGALVIASIALALGFGEGLRDPFKGQPLWLLASLAVLLAPLVENLILFLCFEAASSLASRMRPQASQRTSARRIGGAFAMGFAFLHRAQSPLYGAPIVPVAIALMACFVWGRRHRRRARGFAMSVAIHALVNSLGVALYAL